MPVKQSWPAGSAGWSNGMHSVFAAPFKLLEASTAWTRHATRPMHAHVHAHTGRGRVRAGSRRLRPRHLLHPIFALGRAAPWREHHVPLHRRDAHELPAGKPHCKQRSNQVQTWNEVLPLRDDTEMRVPLRTRPREHVSLDRIQQCRHRGDCGCPLRHAPLRRHGKPRSASAHPARRTAPTSSLDCPGARTSHFRPRGPAGPPPTAAARPSVPSS